jgi:YHS domain-containing protein
MERNVLMILVELFVPKGSLSENQSREISQRLATELVAAEDAPPGVVEESLALTQVIVHEAAPWIVGGRPVDAGEAPRYVVRASVPAAWRKEMSQHLISVATRVLAEADENPQRLYQEPHAWIQVVGVPEGGHGLFGRAMSSTEIVKLITRPFREAPAGSLPARELAPGTAIDPVCGMVAPLSGDGAITLEHDGVTYAFCSTGCRAVFADELRMKVLNTKGL